MFDFATGLFLFSVIVFFPSSVFFFVLFIFFALFTVWVRVIKHWSLEKPHSGSRTGSVEKLEKWLIGLFAWNGFSSVLRGLKTPIHPGGQGGAHRGPMGKEARSQRGPPFPANSPQLWPLGQTLSGGAEQFSLSNPFILIQAPTWRMVVSNYLLKL